ncbi:hypothetical protein K457DRAFT_14369 [Linnemannia elongata AG-77]|uniref:Uncharacterized protein n=1 Tax=Linnemannia elongata AG-77 TaxID=1314771 RepID=A0A197KDR0_9FUNG|nr:hypothetical protein K457DRAFT_14369 [Linnemannia elongata AG-77]
MTIRRKKVSPKKALLYPWTGEGYVEGFEPSLLAELNIREASNAIREKPEWWRKIKEPTIAANWRRELMEESRKRRVRFHLSDAQVDYVLKELEWYARKRQEQFDGGATVAIDFGIEGTRRADGLVPEYLRRRLLQCVKKLENVPDDKKDWHPGSNNQVLDLIHPSLYPFVAGRTRVTEEEAIPPLDFITAGKALDFAPIPKSSAVESIFYSKKHQWLPTDFDITPEGKVKARSYINNLHPVEHKEMYPVLEEILDKFLPMFEEVLSEIEAFPFKSNRLMANRNWYDSDLSDVEVEETDSDYDDDSEGESGGDSECKDEDKVKKVRKLKKVRLPQPIKIPEFVPQDDLPRYNLKTQGKPLQVIVKLANIELTPENPTYGGGTWHVEGMANENIIATGIYYYDTENISDSRLKFRIQIKEPKYEQSDDRGTEHLYGVMNEDALVQYLDGIMTQQDRCVVFPNIYQHQVQTFGLVDRTKPGFRKLLAFFLVNPEDPVLSTTFVPPQQKEWDNRIFLAEVSDKFPPEILCEIDQLVDWPMDLEEAKRHREELMKERRYFSETINTELFERPFNPSLLRRQSRRSYAFNYSCAPTTEGSVGPFKHSVQNKQPIELVDEILSMADRPLNLEEAKKLRKELMNERKYLVKNLTVDVFERPFYLLEH